MSTGTRQASPTVNYGNNVPADRPGLRRDARFTETNLGLHRLILTREWGTCQRLAVCIGLNPSIADHVSDDPTIKAMYGHCDAWDRERLVMINLFTLVATEPKDMLKHHEPEVAGHSEVWQTLFEKPEPKLLVVAAWGAHGVLNDQDKKAMAWLNYWNIKPACLGTNANGTPKHPLYIRRGEPLIPYQGRA